MHPTMPKGSYHSGVRIKVTADEIENAGGIESLISKKFGIHHGFGEFKYIEAEGSLELYRLFGTFSTITQVSL